jgi:hypothetical protein
MSRDPQGDVHKKKYILFPTAQQLLVGQALLIIESSRTRSNTLHSVGLLWTSDQPDVQTATSQHSKQTDIQAPARFELAIPASELPQTHGLVCADTGIDIGYTYV